MKQEREVGWVAQLRLLIKKVCGLVWLLLSVEWSANLAEQLVRLKTIEKVCLWDFVEDVMGRLKHQLLCGHVC